MVEIPPVANLISIFVVYMVCRTIGGEGLCKFSAKYKLYDVDFIFIFTSFRVQLFVLS